jgi:hypothetical protein
MEAGIQTRRPFPCGAPSPEGDLMIASDLCPDRER